MMIYIRF